MIIQSRWLLHIQTSRSMKALTTQSIIRKAINFVILSKTIKKISKHSLGFGIFGNFLNWTFHDITTFFSLKYGHKIFNATISIKHFRFFYSNIRFDDIIPREDRFQHDRVAVVWPFFNYFVENCEKVMVPDHYVSLDETLYPTRVSVAFRQYNKNKHAKYRLLFQLINSVDMPCT